MDLNVVGVAERILDMFVALVAPIGVMPAMKHLADFAGAKVFVPIVVKNKW